LRNTDLKYSKYYSLVVAMQDLHQKYGRAIAIIIITHFWFLSFYTQPAIP